MPPIRSAALATATPSIRYRAAGALFDGDLVRMRLAVGFISADGTPLGEEFVRDFTSRFVRDVATTAPLRAGPNPAVVLYRSGHAPNVTYWLHADVTFDQRGVARYSGIGDALVKYKFAEALAATGKATRQYSFGTRSTAATFSTATQIAVASGPSEASIATLADPAPHDAGWVVAATLNASAPAPQGSQPAPRPTTPAPSTPAPLAPVIPLGPTQGLPASMQGTPLCTVTTRSSFWLRPTATFDHVGPQFSAGTRVDIMDVTSQANSAGLRIYRVRIAAGQPNAGQGGFNAMNAADVASCAAIIATKPPATIVPASTAPVRPTPQRVPVTVDGTGVVPAPSESGMATSTKVAIGAVGVGVVAGIGFLIWRGTKRP